MSTDVTPVSYTHLGLERFTQIMRTEPTLQDAPGALELTHVEGKIDLEHVGFSYDGDLEMCIRDSFDTLKIRNAMRSGFCRI